MIVGECNHPRISGGSQVLDGDIAGADGDRLVEGHQEIRRRRRGVIVRGAEADNLRRAIAGGHAIFSRQIRTDLLCFPRSQDPIVKDEFRDVAFEPPPAATISDDKRTTGIVVTGSPTLVDPVDRHLPGAGRTGDCEQVRTGGGHDTILL